MSDSSQQAFVLLAPSTSWGSGLDYPNLKNAQGANHQDKNGSLLDGMGVFTALQAPTACTINSLGFE
jgi:hypothetical protein